MFGKKNNILFIFLGIIVLGAIWFVSVRNGLVQKQEAIQNGAASIDTQLQRRYELIPNLVSTVKGVTKQENEVFGKIADARSRYTSGTTSNEKLSAGVEIESALARLLVITENYPELKSSEAFQTLMAQLEGTENRIQVSRKDYNELVRVYNTQLKQFPTNMIARLFGFDPAVYFELITPEAEVAPYVTF
jgi:LemA protein